MDGSGNVLWNMKNGELKRRGSNGRRACDFH